MSNEHGLPAVQQNITPMPFGPQSRGLSQSVNAGAVSIEQERAVAEAKGQMQLAKMFPRDLNASYAELMDACKLPALANVAFYSVPQGAQKVTGPSIRLAEQIANSVGNFEWGHRELSRVEATQTNFGRSEIEVYAWDKEKNNRSIRQITVLHVLDTKEGPRRLRDQKDIDNKIANVASKQARGRLLALLPKWIVEAAVEECRKTLAGQNDQPVSVRVRAMTQAFAKFGVTTEHLEQYLKHPLDQTLADEIVDLTGVFNALKEGTPPSEFFGAEQGADDKQSGLADTARRSAEAKTKAESASPATTEQPKAEAAPVEKPAGRKQTQNNSKPVNESPVTNPAQMEPPASDSQEDVQQGANDAAGDFF